MMSFSARAIELNSASAVGSVGDNSFFELQAMAPPFRMNTFLLIDVKLWLLAKLASVYPYNLPFVLPFVYVMLSPFVPHR